MIQKNEVVILLVDDDATDRELFVEAAKTSGIPCRVEELSNGLEVIKHLEEAKTIPAFIMLDLNMPLKDGRETLKELKAHKKLRHIPVLVMSTSNAHFDVLQSYEHGAGMFVSKPHDFEELTEMLKCLLTLASKYVSFPEVNR